MIATAEKTKIKRFSTLERLFHFGLIITFLTQGATGLARMYVESVWGSWLVNIFGGYSFALVIHKWVGITMLFGFAIHTVYLIRCIDFKALPACLLGPDSIIPGPKDALNFLKHVAWFLGLARMPEFDRWGYWEKFDYWAVYWGMIIIGVTGLIMSFQMFSTRFFPGWVLNITFWIHRIEAILAMGHIFIIHFFIAHIRRHSFPMDRAMFEGSVDLEATRHEKPTWVARLEKEGRLEDMLVAEAPLGRRIVYYVFGYTAMGVGLFLLIGSLVNAGKITW